MPKSKFVPEGYNPESGTGNFFKLASGDNKFRILTDAIVGKEGWKDNKPFRRQGVDASISPKEVDEDAKTGKPKINDFMAFYIYDHEDGKVKLATFTQASIKKAIIALAENEDWGHPSGYDITVTKTGEGFNSKYTVTPSPKKPLPKTAQATVDMEEEFFDIEKALGFDEE